MNELEPRHQELIVTQGWYVGHHQFFAIDPTQELVEDHYVFTEDMYQARHEHRDRTLDLGWYPEHDFANGQFRLVLYAGTFLGKLLRQVETNNRTEIVQKINEWFDAVTNGEL